MAKTLGGFRAAVLVGWIVLGAAGILYARIRGIPDWAALPALAAFLSLYPFYLVPAFPAIRERFAGPALPPFIAVSFVLPYLVCCQGAVPLHWTALAQLIALALALSLWYAVLPRAAWADLGFGALVGWVMLGGYFTAIYPEPYDHVEVAYLGRLALFLSLVMVLMLARRMPETGYGFIPAWKDVRVGALHFVMFAAVGLPLALALKAVQFAPPKPVWLIAGTFFAFLWVVGLAEEFLFRGVLQELMEQWTSSRAAALWITSAAFGLVHLPFGGWRWVLIAGAMGWFCGRARNRTGGIRAAVVTHAMVVAAFRGFFVKP